MLRRGRAKILAAAVLAGGVGLAVGVGFSQVGGGGPAVASGPGAKASALAAGAPATRSPSRQGPLRRVFVRVLSAVLRPASTPSGRLRQRARLVVLVRVKNAGASPVTPERPALLIGRARVVTDPRADGPGTRLGTLGARTKVPVALQFELAGARTARVRADRRVQMIIAGRRLDVPVTLGATVVPTAPRARPAP